MMINLISRNRRASASSAGKGSSYLNRSDSSKSDIRQSDFSTPTVELSSAFSDTLSCAFTESDLGKVEKQKKNLSDSFCEDKNIVQDWENPAEEFVNDVWYSRRELNQINSDNKKNSKLSHFHSRGLEDLVKKRVIEAEKIRKQYVQDIMKAHKDNKESSACSSNSDVDVDHHALWETVRLVSIVKSRADRKKAQKRGKEDETDAWHVYKEDKTNSSGATKFRRSANMSERANYFVKRTKKDLPSKMVSAASNLMTSAAKACA